MLGSLTTCKKPPRPPAWKLQDQVVLLILVILLVVKIENITIFVDQNYTQVVENTCIINATIRQVLGRFRDSMVHFCSDMTTSQLFVINCFFTVFVVQHPRAYDKLYFSQVSSMQVFSFRFNSGTVKVFHSSTSFSRYLGPRYPPSPSPM